MSFSTKLLTPILSTNENEESKIYFVDISTDSYYDSSGKKVDHNEVASSIGDWFSNQFNDSMAPLEDIPDPREISNIAGQQIKKTKEDHE